MQRQRPCLHGLCPLEDRNREVPKGYAEILEHTQFALVATVHKLYAMVRSQKQWNLSEPELNNHGQPVIHSIASQLECIRPNSDIDLPGHSVFPEDEDGMAELARHLEEQQQKVRESLDMPTKTKMESQSSSHLSDRSSPFEQGHSNPEVNYRRQVFASSNAMAMSPQFASPIDADAMLLSRAQPMTEYSPPWATAPRATSMELSQQYMPTNAPSQGLRPFPPYPEVMMGTVDPMMVFDSMMFLDFDAEPERL